MIAGFAVLLMVILGWGLIVHPTWTAPTRDPAWYTWRANIILHGDPGSIAGDWGPSSVFGGGYRVTVPLAGALLQRVAGISAYSFSAFLMVAIPILTGLAFGAGAYRARRDPLVVLLTLLASAALFLTTPYVGYLDNITVLFLLSLIVAFAGAARTSWGARVAVFLIAIAVAFTHPTTAVLFGMTLLAVFGFHFLTSRFSFGAALRSDGPLLMATGFGMIAGLAMWVIGIWGVKAKISDAAAPASLHEGVLRGPTERVGHVAETDDHDPAAPRRRDLDDPDGSSPARAGGPVLDGVDLVDVPIRRRAHDPDEHAAVLPVPERVGGAHRARGPGRVRGRALLPPVQGAGARRGSHRGAPGGGFAGLAARGRPPASLDRASPTSGRTKACARRSPP